MDLTAFRSDLIHRWFRFWVNALISRSFDLRIEDIEEEMNVQVYQLNAEFDKLKEKKTKLVSCFSCHLVIQSRAERGN